MEAKPILCIAGAILINLTLGTFYSIGNIIPYIASYMRNNGNPNVTIEYGTWITSTFLLGQGISIILGAYLENRFNNRTACIIGCLIHCSSTFLTIWAIKVNFATVIFIYGLGSGLGCGSAYVAAIIAAQKWYPTRKGVFTGIIVAGFGFGGLIFTSLQTLYMNPRNVKANASGYFEADVYSKVPNLFLYMGIIFTVAQTIGCILSFPPPTTTSDQNENTNNAANGTTIVTEEILPDMKSFSSAFRYKIFYIIGCMMMLVAPGVSFINSLGKRYGQMYIKDDRFLATVVAVAAVANALGRLVWGYLMDLYSFSLCYTVKAILFGLLIILFPFSFVIGSKVLFLFWMLGLFFGFSGTFVLFPLLVEQVFGTKYHGSLYGILYIALALSSILTSIIIQVEISPRLEAKPNPDDNLGIRLSPCIVIAVLYFMSFAVYMSAIPVKRLENAIKRRMEANYAKLRGSLFNRQDLFPGDRGNLAERTAAMARENSNSGNSGAGGIERENSLGSIVKFRDAPKEVRRINTFGKQ